MHQAGATVCSHIVATDDHKRALIRFVGKVVKYRLVATAYQVFTEQCFDHSKLRITLVLVEPFGSKINLLAGLFIDYQGILNIIAHTYRQVRRHRPGRRGPDREMRVFVDKF